MEIYEPIEAPRLHPALEPHERLHLELHGYVIIEGTLTAAETETLRDVTYDLEGRLRAGEVLEPPAYLHAGATTWFRVDNLPHLHEAYADYLTHPRLWGMAEEAIGGEARLEQSDVSLFRPGPDGDGDAGTGFGLHRGGFDGMGHVTRGLYHYPFVKTLTMLTDVGPDDGGTVVLPGSHRLAGLSDRQVITLVDEHPELLHHVVAPAGSTLLFFESTIHGSGIIRSGRDRMFIVGGYTPPMYQPWHEYDPDPEWVAGQPDSLRPFWSGSNRWLWKPRIRDLTAPVQTLEEATADAAERAAKARAYRGLAEPYQRDLGTIE